MNEIIKKYIEKSGYKLKFIAEKIGLTYPGLYNKLIGKNEFTVSEAVQLKQILNMSDEDWRLVFEQPNETI